MDSCGRISLPGDTDTCPGFLAITAETDQGEIVAVARKDYPVLGAQFHPGSTLTEHGAFSCVPADLWGAYNVD